ncbi:MAG: amidohydrolase [Acidobacteria bacterium]|nr:amidohydrolase [Acidobacteriota bacterium]
MSLPIWSRGAQAMGALLISLAGGLLPAQVTTKVDLHAERLGAVSRQIWELAEVGYKEQKSSALLQEELRRAGFSVESGTGGIPTAFVATYGTGKPVIGLMAEYDALPGLSQEDTPQRAPRQANAPGHGCGHNLLGAGAVLAAIALKEQGFRGTLKVFGTPAEEGGGGKVYMIRAGAFAGVDAVLAWHPGDANQASLRTTLANITAKFRFRGVAAHAAVNPEQGRSALDAVMLFNHAIDLLREHVPQETRLHYIITQGGVAPNVVPDFAEVYVYARHPSMKVLDNVWSRIEKAAAGAALATETRQEMAIQSAVYNMLPNDTLAALYDRHLRVLGGIQYGAGEKEFAAKLRTTLFAEPELALGSEARIQPIAQGAGAGSTDAADVSWVVPTSELSVATFAPGIPFHSWQSTACAGMSIGRKGMVLAAKVLALTAMDLFTEPAQLAAARQAFDQRRAGFAYQSRLPQDAKPPLNYRDSK